MSEVAMCEVAREWCAGQRGVRGVDGRSALNANPRF